jgi:hypothetical protein
MKLKDYFIKGKNYFLALIGVTILQSALSLFSIIPIILINFLSIIKLMIAGYSSYKLGFNIRESLLFGALMFLCVIWYLPFAIPAYMFMLDSLSIILFSVNNALINIGLYSIVSAIACLIRKKRGKK